MLYLEHTAKLAQGAKELYILYSYLFPHIHTLFASNKHLSSSFVLMTFRESYILNMKIIILTLDFEYRTTR